LKDIRDQKTDLPFRDCSRDLVDRRCVGKDSIHEITRSRTKELVQSKPRDTSSSDLSACIPSLPLRVL
jgi:hypothetical protein